MRRFLEPTAERFPDGPSIADATFHADQYRTYAQLRQEGPVGAGRYFDGTPIWLLTHYEHVRAALQDRRLSNDLRGSEVDVLGAFGIPPDLQVYWQRTMINADPPDHTRLRRAVSHAFTFRRVEELRPRIAQIADRLLAELDADATVDLMEHFAHPLPIAVICELLGVPDADRDDWRVWAMALVLTDADPRLQTAALGRGARGLVDRCRRLVRLRRAEPTEDLISDLVRAHGGDAAQLDDEELVAMVIGLLNAGHRASVRLIGNAVFALLTHPLQLEGLRADPSLLPAAVEEVLRYSTSAELGALRLATEDIDVDGLTIPAGGVVQVVLAAANRDPCRFAAPDQFTVTRPDNAHLAFGYGRHVCLGAALARTEVEIALRSLLGRFPKLALAVPPSEVRWYPSFARGPMRLPVRLR